MSSVYTNISKEGAVALVLTTSPMNNPFLDDTPKLLTLDTHNDSEESVVSNVGNKETVGRDQYTSVLMERTRSIHDPMNKNFL